MVLEFMWVVGLAIATARLTVVALVPPLETTVVAVVTVMLVARVLAIPLAMAIARTTTIAVVVITSHANTPRTTITLRLLGLVHVLFRI